MVSGPKFTELFSLNAGRNVVVHQVFRFWISLGPVRFGDILAQSGKVSEIAPNWACFCPQNFFGGKPPNFWTGIYKLNMLPTMWRNFAEIGPRTSEISLWKKRNSSKT